MNGRHFGIEGIVAASYSLYKRGRLKLVTETHLYQYTVEGGFSLMPSFPVPWQEHLFDVEGP